MVKIRLLLFVLLLTTMTESIEIHCNYKNEDTHTSYSYYCDVENQLNVMSTNSANINFVRGDHDFGQSNDNVTCLHVSNKNVQIFPKGIQKIFKNLKRIDIYFGRLKEINQDDLKAFPQLIELDLYNNDIQILEDKIFAYNLRLTYINFSYNKLVQIGENVFKMMNLSFLGLFSNGCISKTASNSTKAVLDIIALIKINCGSEM
ncbi:hypothetical protein ACKWTF_010345 [Chironomus riparius]